MLGQFRQVRSWGQFLWLILTKVWTPAFGYDIDPVMFESHVVLFSILRYNSSSVVCVCVCLCLCLCLYVCMCPRVIPSSRHQTYPHISLTKALAASSSSRPAEWRSQKPKDLQNAVKRTPILHILRFFPQLASLVIPPPFVFVSPPNNRCVRRSKSRAVQSGRARGPGNVSAEVLFAGYPEVLPMLKDRLQWFQSRWRNPQKVVYCTWTPT